MTRFAVYARKGHAAAWTLREVFEGQEAANRLAAGLVGGKPDLEWGDDDQVDETLVEVVEDGTDPSKELPSEHLIQESARYARAGLAG